MDKQEFAERYPTDRGKPKRRRIANAVAEGLAERNVYGVEKDRSRKALTHLPGNGMLHITEAVQASRVTDACTAAASIDRQSPGGWVGLAHYLTGKEEIVVTLPLRAFLTIMQRLEET
jgi:hypothetical protein